MLVLSFGVALGAANEREQTRIASRSTLSVFHGDWKFPQAVFCKRLKTREK
jgi:hypothetical protein